MDSGYHLFTLGTSRKKIAPDHLLNDSLVRKRRIVLYKIEDVLKSLKEAFKFLTGFRRKRVLILSIRSQNVVLQELRRIKKENRFISYFAHKWVAGFLTNSRVVKHNAESVKSFKSQNSLRVYQRIYEGVTSLKGLPHLLIVIGGNLCNVAIKEALSMNIPVIALRDTDARFTKDVVPIFTNASDVRIHLLLLRWIERNLNHNAS